MTHSYRTFVRSGVSTKSGEGQTLRDTPASIRDYFKGLPDQPPQVKVALGEQRTRVYGDTAINTGLYAFVNIRDGNPLTIPARFKI
jgi:hypothetical protein